MNFQFVKKSSNSKTGPIPITNSHKNTCPPACKFRNEICYASTGFRTNLNWEKLTRGERGASWRDFLPNIERLEHGTLWRHNVSGDLIGENDVINAKALRELIRANSGKRGFTYTHYPLTAANVASIRAAISGGFTVNASADSIDHAIEIRRKYPDLPICTVAPENYNQALQVIDGIKFVQCPATRRDTNCASCKLCQNPNRDGAVIVFPAHGSKKSQYIATDRK